MTAPGRVRSVAWLLPTVAMGFLTWTSFLYLGLRTRHRPFLYWAAGYFAVIAFALVITPDEDDGSLSSALSTVGVIAVWLGGFVHAVVVHKSYAAWRGRPAAHQLTPQWPAPSSGVPQLGLPEPHWFGPADGRPVPTWGRPPAAPAPGAPTPPAPAPPQPAPQPPAPAVPLDLNTATVAELAAIPAVGPVLARRLVAERTARGGFTSVEQLLTLGLAPHVVASLLRHARLAPAEPGAPGPQTGQPSDPPHRTRGRVLDV